MIPGASAAAVSTEVSTAAIYTSASAWAKPEIERAYDCGLIPHRLLTADAPQPATREEFCELTVRLYEQVTGETAAPISPNPFTDTANTEILKAYQLGITTGTSATTFSPQAVTNREQVTTMFGRTIRLMFPDGDYSLDGAPVFSDQADISPWAVEHVKFMSKAGILIGAGGKFMPRAVTDAQKATGYGTTKREEAIAIAVRIYTTYATETPETALSDAERAVLSLIETSSPSLSEEEQFAQIDFNNRPFRPVYHPRLTLAAADGFDSGGSPTFSSFPYAAVIRSGGDQIHPFKLTLPADVLAQTSQIVWQVALVPFDGTAVSKASSAPGGLLLSGSLPKQTSQFTIDFAKVVQAEDALRQPKTGGLKTSVNPNLLKNVKLNTNTSPQSLMQSLMKAAPAPAAPPRTYYVRAYAVDSAGNSIGDAGSGLAVLYGDPAPARDGKQITVTPQPFSLKLAGRPGPVSYSGGEFQVNSFSNNLTESRITTNGYKSYSILPVGFPADTRELMVQVSLIKNTGTANDSWQKTSGLVYQQSVFPDDPVFADLKGTKPLGIAVDFSQFVPADSLLPDQDIAYYLRVVAFTKGEEPGTVNARYSQTVLIRYGKPLPFPEIYDPPKPTYITPNLPRVTQVSYESVDFELAGWYYHYIVTRQPTYKEVFGGMFGVFNVTAANDPYPAYPVGTKLDFTPQPPEDKPWYKDLWDAITGFFSDLVGFLSKVYNWVQTAYADLKAGVIKFALSTLPLPDSFKGPLKTALTALVDYGLMAVGIPPTLPNFDQLAEMGVSYLATMAMDQAGIPGGELVEYGVDTLADGIKDGLKSCTKSGSPNPRDWDFIKYDPEWLYRPAYIMLDLYNPSATETTPAGRLSCTVTTQLDTSLNQIDPVISNLWAIYQTREMMIFKPVYGLEIPEMAPGQRITVPVFLEEYIGLPLKGSEASVRPQDYHDMYFELGEYDFQVFISYDLPPVLEEAEKQGYSDEEALYQYAMVDTGVYFTTLPYQSYSKSK